MKFYNNIFASAYRCYDRYENSPRYKAASFVFICLLGFFAMLLGIVKKIFILDFTSVRNYTEYKITFVITGFFFLGLLWKYYSKVKAETIIDGFEKKAVGERKLWGFITVAAFVLPWAIFAFLLSK
jgi:hypothetical protein